jgi:hypothetical protein
VYEGGSHGVSPPFTIQRIAELLDQPMAMHSSIGKFLRAVEKALLVNTPWDPPSYTYVPPSQTTALGCRKKGIGLNMGVEAPGGNKESSSDPASDDAEDVDPPAPKIASPVAFLRHPNADESPSMEVDGQGSNSRGQEEGLMSPLMLGGRG